MREVPLGDFLRPSRDAEPLLPDEEYQTAGILNRGRGLFHRPVVRGRDVTYPQYYRLRTGHFVYSRLFVWEGALAIVDPDFDGHYVSPEFPTFVVDERLASPAYVAVLCRWPVLWERIRSMETGMGGRRKRVYPRALLTVGVPLPPLAEQRRVVDLVTAMDVVSSASQGVLTRAHAAKGALLARDLPDLPRGRVVEVRDVCELIARGRAPAYVESGGQTVLSQKCIRDGSVDASVARRTDTTERPVAEWAWVRAGDTLVNSTGRGTVGRAGFVAEIDGLATVDSHVTIVRPDPDRIIPAFLAYALFVRKVELEASATGSTNQTELSRDSIASLRIPLPERREQAETVKTLSSVDAYIKAAARFTTSCEKVRTRALSGLLSGDHEIPASYDRLLDGAE
jgi:Type I restriction modification DNA specificity domain